MKLILLLAGGVILVGLALLVFSSLSKSGGSTANQQEPFTALSALRKNMATLKQNHPKGKVVLMGGDIQSNNSWITHVWDPEKKYTQHYQLNPNSMTNIGSSGLALPDTRPIIASLESSTIADVWDSDKIRAEAEDLTKNWRQKTGGELRSMTLSGYIGEELDWTLFYSQLNTNDPNDRINVVIDAKSGKPISILNEDGEQVNLN